MKREVGKEMGNINFYVIQTLFYQKCEHVLSSVGIDLCKKNCTTGNKPLIYLYQLFILPYML